jgi:hypothetical protein
MTIKRTGGHRMPDCGSPENGIAGAIFGAATEDTRCVAFIAFSISCSSAFMPSENCQPREGSSVVFGQSSDALWRLGVKKIEGSTVTQSNRPVELKIGDVVQFSCNSRLALGLNRREAIGEVVAVNHYPGQSGMMVDVRFADGKLERGIRSTEFDELDHPPAR